MQHPQKQQQQPLKVMSLHHYIHLTPTMEWCSVFYHFLI